MYEFLTALLALELALPEEDIPKHVLRHNINLECSKTSIVLFKSLRMRYLDKAATLLFRNSTATLERKCCCLFQITRIRYLQ